MGGVMGVLRDYLPLFKLRICSLIAFSAVVGLISASSPRLTFLTVAVLASVTLMSAAGASAFNHYFDMDIDSRMTRTSGRPLVTGRVRDSRKALVFASALLVLSVLISWGALNLMAALHLFLGAFVYAVVYTVWLKRRSSLNIVIGGLAGSFAVLAGGVSADPQMCLPPVLLSIVMFFWTPTHFWSFAIVHREEYEKAGVPMLPAVIGDKRTARYILANSALLVSSSFAPLFFGYFGPLYAVSSATLGAYVLILNVRLLRDPTRELAWKNFKASMLYIGGLFMAVVLDALVIKVIS